MRTRFLLETKTFLKILLRDAWHAWYIDWRQLKNISLGFLPPALADMKVHYEGIVQGAEVQVVR